MKIQDALLTAVVYLGLPFYWIARSKTFGHLWVVFVFLWRIIISYLKAAVFFGSALVLIPWAAYRGEFGDNSRCCRTGCHSCPYGYKTPKEAIISFVESL